MELRVPRNIERLGLYGIYTLPYLTLHIYNAYVFINNICIMWSRIERCFANLMWKCVRFGCCWNCCPLFSCKIMPSPPPKQNVRCCCWFFMLLCQCYLMGSKKRPLFLDISLTSIAVSAVCMLVTVFVMELSVIWSSLLYTILVRHSEWNVNMLIVVCGLW
jgi:hypothetical protein